jgi:uncharacterized protein YqgC (DUF456 family)
MFDIILLTIGLIIAIIGLIGCIVPAIPGPPLNFISLIVLEFVVGGAYSLTFYIVWGIITVATIILDYVFPVWSAKIYKVSNAGIWGSVIGMIVGILFFPPFGMMAGLILGAVIGELMSGKKSQDALKAGMVTFISTLLMIIFKFAVSGIMTYYFIKSAAGYLL